MTKKTDRCTTLRLDLRDLARSAEDPKLASLLSDGWTVIAHIAVAEDDGAPGLVLLLAPPPEALVAVDAPTPSARRRPDFVYIALLLGWLSSLVAWVLSRWAP